MAEQPDVAALVAFYNQINHYGRTNGLQLTVQAPGRVTYTMKVREDHLSSPGTCHGGVVAGLMDAVLGAAALTQAFVEQELVSTVEFKMNFLHPVRLHDELVATARVEHHGKSLVVVDGTIECPARQLTVARGLGTFNRYPASKRDFIQALTGQLGAEPDAPQTA
ncbi:PaaI family thioesterase [Hymenobacter busanensis]|uniref:PaaI family thioesterase n=1 Tax=Hymenobacter busanensis TaxID=2607656 RepID=A0A7L4ZYC2_9BACT|nr:PaaI family thioesterase [Hymenobacter busanensis]KAA9333482.1 PaaI family thioesterase [Hymenobacter busanensis]QHJ07835.1 hotdog fold thioesterase [Hymenobacter busanensis]